MTPQQHRKARRQLIFASSTEDTEQEEESESDQSLPKRVLVKRTKSLSRQSLSSPRKLKTKEEPKRKAWTSPQSIRHRWKNEAMEEDSGSESSSSSEQDERKTKIVCSEHILKPPKFDGVMPFKTFWAQFQNCAKHNQWDRKQKLVYLRNSLDKEAANVLWTTERK